VMGRSDRQTPVKNTCVNLLVARCFRSPDPRITGSPDLAVVRIVLRYLCPALRLVID
jgi:hypothetical protein